MGDPAAARRRARADAARLQHTNASRGANVQAVQRMLGHASAAVTLDVYAELFDADTDALRAALDRVALRPSRVQRSRPPEKVEARDQFTP